MSSHNRVYSLNVLVYKPLKLTAFVTVAVDRMTYGFCVVDTLPLAFSVIVVARVIGVGIAQVFEQYEV
jgi:hypothetical protein